MLLHIRHLLDYNKKKFTALLLLVLWAGAILVVSIWPANKMPDISLKFSDKMGHLVAYAILSILAILYTKLSGRMSNRTGHWFIITLLVTVLYGSLLEIIQGAMSIGRNFEFLDIMADAAGSFIGLTIAGLFMTLQKRQV